MYTSQNLKTSALYPATATAMLALCALGIISFIGLVPAAPMGQDVYDAVSHLDMPGAGDLGCGNCGVVEQIRAIEVPVIGRGSLGNGNSGANNAGSGSLYGAAARIFSGSFDEYLANFETRYMVTLRMQDGSLRVSTVNQQPPYAEGDRIRLSDTDAIVPNGRAV